jgi:hypothetical protein
VSVKLSKQRFRFQFQPHPIVQVLGGAPAATWKRSTWWLATVGGGIANRLCLGKPDPASALEYPRSDVFAGQPVPDPNPPSLELAFTKSVGRNGSDPDVDVLNSLAPH